MDRIEVPAVFTPPWAGTAVGGCGVAVVGVTGGRVPCP